MSELKFAVGDVVELKSGSVPMTVGGIGNNFVKCFWWDESKGLQWLEIPEYILQKKKAPSY